MTKTKTDQKSGKKAHHRYGTHPIFGAPVLLPGEDINAYNELFNRAMEHFKPKTIVQELLVNDFVKQAWHERWFDPVRPELVGKLKGWRKDAYANAECRQVLGNLVTLENITRMIGKRRSEAAYEIEWHHEISKRPRRQEPEPIEVEFVPVPDNDNPADEAIQLGVHEQDSVNSPPNETEAVSEDMPQAVEHSGAGDEAREVDEELAYSEEQTADGNSTSEDLEAGSEESAPEEEAGDRQEVGESDAEDVSTEDTTTESRTLETAPASDEDVTEAEHVSEPDGEQAFADTEVAYTEIAENMEEAGDDVGEEAA